MRYENYTRRFNNSIPYSGRNWKDDTEIQELFSKTYTPSYNMPVDEGRSLFDRTIDGLSTANYMVAGFAKGFVDNDAPDGGVTPWQGMIDGLRAGNPFGKGYQKGETTFSDVLHHTGWQPEGIMGKIAKGTVGFGMDVLLDPTTYLTGGLSAVVKGTGKVGKTASSLGKLAENMPYMQYDNIVKDLTDKGVNPQLAERFAQKKLDEALSSTDEVTHMTDSMAEEIIKYQNLERGRTMSSDEITSSASKLSSEYNRLLGLREGKDARPITFGVENLPFGEKLAPKLGVLGKTLTLSDGDKLRQFGDKSGLAFAYSKLRDNIYGRQVGKLLSTNAKLYDLAHKDPSELFDFVKFIEITRGLNKGKSETEKLIRDRAKTMGLTPDESSEVLRLLQDKTIWQQVTEKVKFSELEQVKAIRESLNTKKQATQTQLQDLMDKRGTYELLQEMADKDMLDAKKGLDEMRNTYGEELAKLDLRHIDNKEQLKQVRKAIRDEIKRLDKELVDERVKHEALMKNSNGIPIEQLDSLFDDMTTETDEADKYFDTVRNLSEKKKQVEANRKVVEEETPINPPVQEPKTALQSEYDELGKQIDEYVKGNKTDKPVQLERDGKIAHTSELAELRKKRFEIRKEIEANPVKNVTSSKDKSKSSVKKEAIQDTMIKALDDEIIEVMKEKPSAEKRYTLITALNKAIFGGENKLPRTLKGKSIENLINMFKEGKTKDDIAKHIEDNDHLYSEHATEVYKYLAEKYGYKSWKETYHDPMNAMREKIGRGEELDPWEYQDWLKLSQLHAYRRRDFEKHFGRQTYDEFKEMRRNQANEGLMKSLENEVDLDLDTKRKKFMDDSRAHQGGMKTLHTLKDSGFDKMVKKLIGEGKSPEVAERLARKEIKDKGRVGSAEIENIDRRYTEFIERESKSLRDIMSSDEQTSMFHDAVELFQNAENRRSAKYGRGRVYDTNQQLSTRALKTVQELTSNMSTLLQTNFKGRAYSDLTRGQKDYLFNMAMKNPKLAKQEIDELQKHAMKEIQRRANVARIEAVTGTVKEGSIVSFHDGRRAREGDVVGIEHTENGLVYKVHTSRDNVTHDVSVSDVRNVRRNKKIMTPEQLVMDAPVATHIMEETQRLNKRLGQVKYQGTKIKKQLDKDKAELLDFFRVRSDEQKSVIMKYEDIGKQHEEALRNLSPEETKLRYQLDQQEEILMNDDALETYIRTKHGDKVDKWIESSSGAGTGRWVLKSDMPESDKIKHVVEELQREFELMGAKEVGIGKLDADAFTAMLRQYVPHILTPEGERYLNSIKELKPHGTSITQDLGYGQVFNNFARSRTTHGTVEEINKHFREQLNGKNLFQENVADVYVARALKHTELMYDNEYMNTMMNVFGKDIDVSKGVEKGYKAVINVGMLRNTSNELASVRTSLHMSEALSAHLADRGLWSSMEEMSRMNGTPMDDLIQAEINRFMKENFSDEIINQLYKDNLSDLWTSNKLPDYENFAKVVTPMVELDSKQINSLAESFRNTMAEYEIHLQKQINNAMMRGDNTRVASLSEKLSQIGNVKPFQIKQVNDVIVDKANQARKLQLAKDQSRFLQMYDKFLHFMKLNQTTVMPSFHIRNKMSNMYLNWLGVGRDSVNPEFQKSAWQAVTHMGDAEKLKDLKPLVSEDGTKVYHWNDIYELAKQYNVIDEGFFAKDLGSESASKGLFKKMNTRTKDGKFVGLDPTDTENFVLYKAGANVGSRIENSDRLIHFASQLKSGKSVEEASASVTKFLFDYSDLTSFEKSVMKRIFPYYTWMRKNARLQVGELIEQPEKFLMVAKTLNGINHMNSEEERMNDSYVSDFARDWIQTPFSKKTVHTNADGSVVEGKEPILLSPNMPFMDIGRIPDPTKPLDSLRGLASQMAPVPKAILELGTNHNMFFNDAIIKEGEDPVAEVAKYGAGQFALANAVGGTTSAEDDGDAIRSLMSTLTGVKTLSYDYETSKNMNIAEAIKRRLEK